MKKLFLLLAAAGMIFTACEELGGLEDDNNNQTEQPGDGNEGTPGDDGSEDQKPGDDNKEEVIFETDDEGNVIVEAEGGDVVVTVVTNIEYTVKIPVEAQSWLSLADTRAVRIDKLKFTIAKNQYEDERTADVLLLDSENNELQKITFKQKGAPVEEPEKEEDVFETDSEGNVIVEAEGGDVAVTVVTNIEYTVKIPVAAQSWLSLADTRAVRIDKLKFTIAKNQYEDERTADVLLLDSENNELQKITFKQKGAPIEEPEVDDVTRFMTDVEFVKYCLESFDINNDNQISTLEAERVRRIDITSRDISDVTGVEYFPNLDIFIAGSSNDVYAAPLVYCDLSRNSKLVEVCFHNCLILREVKLPNIKQIAAYAFANCPKLSQITIPESVLTIGNYAFMGCTGRLIINSIIVETNFDWEPDWIRLSSFKEIVIGNNITKIGDYAFYGCTSLTSVTIPDSVTSIGYCAFRDCTSLTSITIPNRVTSIGASAFNGCTSLTSVNIPDSVTSIGGSAFSSCTGELIINNKIVETDYTNYNFPMDNSSSWLYGSKFTKLTIGDNITKIGDYVFYGCSSLTSVTIGNGVTSIGDYVFYYSTLLTSVTIPDSIISIGEKAFSCCYALEDTYVNITDLASYSTSNLMHNILSNKHLLVNGTEIKELVIPDSVTSIGYSAFEYCTSLTSVTIPDSVTSIGNSAFKFCESLTSVTIPDSVTSIGEYAFSGCTGELVINSKFVEADYTDENSSTWDPSDWLCGSKFTKLTIGDNITKIGAYAFYYYSSLKSITIPDSVTSIGTYAFYQCTSLTSVTIGNSVTSIGVSAFSCCPSLTAFYGKYVSEDNRCLIVNGVLNYFAIGCGATSYTIPAGVTSIGGDAFLNCTSLTSVTIPDSVTSIGDYAFRGCTSLTTITIPNRVTSIGNRAFCECTSLISVYCKPTTPPAGGLYMFSYANYSSGYYEPLGCKIYVPRNSVSAYKAATYWKDYASDIVGYNF